MTENSADPVVTAPAEQPAPLDCYWAAGYTDRSGIRIFATEIECLRAAVAYSYSFAERREFGTDPFTGKDD